MKTIPDKRMVKFGIFKNFLFELILKRIDMFTFGCMVVPLGPHSDYTLRGPKGFVN
jgi:hypothetical protein